jgi:hypothetical protein
MLKNLQVQHIMDISAKNEMIREDDYELRRFN